MKVSLAAHLKHVAYGFAASSMLLALYFGIVGYLQGLDYVIGRFAALWYLMLPLVVGFGIQIGLYSCIRDAIKSQAGTMAASGGMSGASMVACCAHHLTDVAPILGASALGIFLVDYQSAFLIVGIFSNITGILMMMDAAKKSRVKFQTEFFRNAMKWDYGRLVKIAVAAGIILTLAAFFMIKPVQEVQDSGIDLGLVSDSQNSVTFDVDPSPLKINEPVNFSISMNTHSVALDFDPREVSTLFMDNMEYKAVEWKGSGPGGHHRSGVLVFPAIGKLPKNMKLVMKNAAGADRIFEWNLK